MSTFSKIQDIFYSGSQSFRGELEVINELSFLVDEKYLSLRTVTIAKRDAYVAALNEVTSKEHAFDDAAGGGNAHVALKIVAGEYLESQMGIYPRYEQPFCGYYPDVLSADKTVVIECGHTQNPDKILRYFRHGNVRVCIQVPYPGDTYTEVLGYSFSAGRDLYDFLDFLESEKRRDIKTLLNKRTM